MVYCYNQKIIVKMNDVLRWISDLTQRFRFVLLIQLTSEHITTSSSVSPDIFLCIVMSFEMILFITGSENILWILLSFNN